MESNAGTIERPSSPAASVPAWGTWATTHDSAAPPIAVAADVSAGATLITLATPGVEVNIGSTGGPRSGSCALSGYLPLVLPTARGFIDRFRGYVVTAEGFASVLGASSATLTITVGDGTHSIEWPLTGPDQDADWAMEFFVSHGATGNTTPVPPLGVAITAQAQCGSGEGDGVAVTVATVSISMVGLME